MLPPPMRLIGWILLLLVPHGLVLYWAFHAGPLTPADYLKNIYDFGAIDKGWSPLVALPLYAVGLAALLATCWAKRRERLAQSTSVKIAQAQTYFWSRWGVVEWAVFLGVSTLGGSCFACGTDLIGSVSKLLPGLVMVLAAMACGLRILEFPGISISTERTASALERLVLATALGLGLLALLVFMLGSMGVLSPYFWWPFLGLLLGLGFRPLKRCLVEFETSLSSFTARHHPLTNAALLVLAILLLAQLALMWTSPLDYDVLEYHLGGPAQHFHTGHVSFLDENLYANMPGNGEMLFLLPMCLVQDRLAALPAAHLLVMTAWLAGIAAVYVLSARLLKSSVQSSVPDPNFAQTAGLAAMMAALFYMLVPWGSELLADFYVEQFQALFQTVALLTACIFWQERSEKARSPYAWLVVCGILCGLGCGFKYPVLLFTLAPLTGYLALCIFLNGSFYEALRCVLSIGIPAAAMLSPWLLRNGIASGDPIFPLGWVMYSRWGMDPSELPSRIQNLDLALRSGGNSSKSLGSALRSLFPGVTDFMSILLGLHMGPHLLAWLGVGLAACCTRARLLVAVIFFWDIAAWLFLTHRVDRFFYPCLAPLAVIAAWGFVAVWTQAQTRKLIGVLCAATVLSMGPLGAIVVYQYSNPRAILALDSPEEAASRQYHALGNGSWFEAWQAINPLPAGSRTLLLGDAQTFYLKQTPAYATVFNESLLENILQNSTSAKDVAHLLALRGITHLYINASEWERLDSTYALKSSLRNDSKNDWERATLSLRLRRELQRALAYGHYAEYGRLWPEGIVSGYLRLKPEEYRRFEDFIKRYTRVVWPAKESEQDRKYRIVPGTELRAIEP